MSEAYPSDALVSQLEDAMRLPNESERRSLAWRLVMQASANPDGGIVRDMAVDNGMIVMLGDKPGRSQAGPLASQSWVNPCDGSEMIWIPPGPFLCGKKREKVTLPGFSLARHPITNEQFARFLNETGYHPPSWHPRGDLFVTGDWMQLESLPPRFIAPEGMEKHPVTWVSFVDALFYCRWAGLTLPTEWLWEKAARGPEGRRFPWGESLPREAPFDVVNVSSDGTVAVGAYPRTRTVYGCEDLIGNVAEWCQRTPGDRPDFIPGPLAAIGPPEDPEAIVVEAVRGSCYLRTDESRMVAWHRRRLSRTRRNQWVGFRPACLAAMRPGP
jgi:serine/threonine-protein kinase